MPNTIKRVLYVAPHGNGLIELLEGLQRAKGFTSEPSAVPPSFASNGVTVRLFAQSRLSRVWSQLQSEYFNLVVLDLRVLGSAFDLDAVTELLRRLDEEAEPEARYAFDRIVALVPAESSAKVDGLIAALAARGVRRFLHAESSPGELASRFASTLLDAMGGRPEGKWALCASGGGITGIYYELGVLKCLDDCLWPASANDFDLFFGISAGAVVAGTLAVGYSVDELMAAIAGVEGGRIPRLDLSVLRPAHLNLAAMARRVGSTGRALLAGLGRVATGRMRPSISALFFDYSDVVGPFFRTDGYAAKLRQIFGAPGATDDFRKLPRPLFIGATDQDTRRPVLFGGQGQDSWPISTAIQASMSLNPAFAPTPVGTHFYEDGAVTRTSNFSEAIERGADLVVVVDPLVPFVSPVGYSHRRGLLYNVDQNIRSLSFTRFELARQCLLRARPDVSLYTFLPGNELRRGLSNNPLDHRNYRAIWKGAYLSTYQRLRILEHRLRGDLSRHGLTLQTARARAVARRLTAAGDRPRFEDFYPDGRAVVRRPPLALESRRPSRSTPDEGYRKQTPLSLSGSSGSGAG